LLAEAALERLALGARAGRAGSGRHKWLIKRLRLPWPRLRIFGPALARAARQQALGL
jgi:hypothetical protein